MFALLELAHFAFHVFYQRPDVCLVIIIYVIQYVPIYIFKKNTENNWKKEAWSNLDIVIMLFVSPTVTRFSKA